MVALDENEIVMNHEIVSNRDVECPCRTKSIKLIEVLEEILKSEGFIFVGPLMSIQNDPKGRCHRPITNHLLFVPI